ncbi:MAG: hypothetical protein N3A67_09895 [Ignavibacteria bacterium]|nr:hypothetical protein [Ignavibacteria bacterium]
MIIKYPPFLGFGKDIYELVITYKDFKKLPKNYKKEFVSDVYDYYTKGLKFHELNDIEKAYFLRNLNKFNLSFENGSGKIYSKNNFKEYLKFKI